MAHSARAELQNPEGFHVDLALLRAFERGLDPQHPECSRVPARVLGYGEISTVFEIQEDGLRGLAFKRLPIFYTQDEMAKYRAAYETYNQLLQGDIGICLPPHGYAAFLNEAGRPIFYIIQQQVPSAAVGHQALHVLPRAEVLILFRRILQELHQVWTFNCRQPRLQVGIDGQLSNWAIVGFNPEQPDLGDETALVYMDTSTPLFRIEGVEQLDPELFLRSAPSFFRWLLRALFLEDVINRYYDFHLVAVDLIANFYKEQRPDLIPDLVGVANEFFSTEALALGAQPITEREVRAYYREDALIWSIYLAARRLDRFLHTRLLRRDYPYILPGRVRR